MTRVCPKVVVLLATAVLGLGISCQRQRAAPGDSRAGHEAVIRVTSLAYVGAAADRNFDKVASFYAEDAWLLPPHGPIAHGREQIRQFWSQWMTNRAYGLGWHTTELEAAKHGGLGYEMGTYEWTQDDASGKRVTSGGKFLVIWEEQGTGVWKMATQMFNTDAYPAQVQSAIAPVSDAGVAQMGTTQRAGTGRGR